MLNRLKGTALPPLVLLALAGALLLSSHRTKIGGVDFGRIPDAFPGWQGHDSQVDDKTVEILQPDGLLMRRYQDVTGRVAWLCIVYHENNKYGAHDVPVCYTSQGYAKESLNRWEVPFGHGKLLVNRLLAGKVNDTRVVYYWFAIGGRYFVDSGEFRRAQMISGLLRNRSEGALVRLETSVEGGDVAAADARLEDLTRRVAGVLPRVFDASAGATPAISENR
jgi:EpsI family protein